MRRYRSVWNEYWEFISWTILRTQIIHIKCRKQKCHLLQRLHLGWKLMFALRICLKYEKMDVWSETIWFPAPLKTRSCRWQSVPLWCVPLLPFSLQSGLTSLHLAAQEDKVNVADILTKHGADQDACTKVQHIFCHCCPQFRLGWFLVGLIQVNSWLRSLFLKVHSKV